MTWPSTPDETRHRDQHHAYFDFDVLPDYNVGKSSRPVVTKVQVQNPGAEQRLRFGLNNDLKVYNLTFSSRSDNESDYIEGFLSDRSGVDAFTWREPNEPFSIADYNAGGYIFKRFVCDEWNRTYNSYNNNTVTAVFREVKE